MFTKAAFFFIPKYSKNINIVIFFNKYCDILLLRFTSCLTMPFSHYLFTIKHILSYLIAYIYTIMYIFTIIDTVKLL